MFPFQANKVTDEKKPNEAQILFDRLIQSTIKSTRTRAGMREKGNVGMEAVRVNLERQLNEDINSITTPRKTASHLNCSHGNLTKRNQTEVVNFYEVEEEMMGIDWKPRTTVEDRCTDPVAKLLDKVIIPPTYITYQRYSLPFSAVFLRSNKIVDFFAAKKFLLLELVIFNKN